MRAIFTAYGTFQLSVAINALGHDNHFYFIPYSYQRTEQVVVDDGAVEGDSLQGWSSGRVEGGTRRYDVAGLGNFSLSDDLYR